MRTPFTRFLAKVGAVVLGLLTFILLGSAITGGLSFIGAICLVPACGYVAAGLAEAAVRPKRRRRVARATAPTPRTQAAGPRLRVVKGRQQPGNKPPHAA